MHRYSTCFPELPVPEHGHDHQQVPDNIHHDGRDQHAGQHCHHPGEGLVLLTRSSFLPRRRGVAGHQGPLHHGGLMVLKGHQLREVPRVDESHWVVVAEGRSIQHYARRVRSQSESWWWGELSLYNDAILDAWRHLWGRIIYILLFLTITCSYFTHPHRQH